MFRREREFKIFTWSSTMFLALMGVLLVVKKPETILWLQFGLAGRIIASITICILIFYSISWQNRERRLGNRHAQVTASINKLLHCFDNEYFDLRNGQTLFPIEWENWGQANISSMKRFLRANLVTATWLLGVLDIFAIWFS